MIVRDPVPDEALEGNDRTLELQYLRVRDDARFIMRGMVPLGSGVLGELIRVIPRHVSKLDRNVRPGNPLEMSALRLRPIPLLLGVVRGSVARGHVGQ
ncbi:MAG: hypothetical protein ACYC6J_09010, partial [Coriobacteriia bacterium]